MTHMGLLFAIAHPRPTFCRWMCRRWPTPGPPMPPHPPTTVVLARFDDLFARGLSELIEHEESLAILAVDVEHRRIPAVLRAHRPDVAILDAGALSRPVEVRDLSDSYPATRLVLLGRDPTPVECAQLLAFGASACLGRDTQARDVINAIHLASRGLQVIPRVAGSGGGPVAEAGRLTRREAEVLPLLQLGRSNAQIALELRIGVETVRTHARNIYRKLGVSSRRDLAPATSVELPVDRLILKRRTVAGHYRSKRPGEPSPSIAAINAAVRRRP
jgi:DNA-binding NarL/FixJ family response regulator